MINQWDIWFAEFPLEVLSIKVTSHNLRDADDFDTPILKWREANLKQESVARISKTINLTKDKFRRKIGDLHTDDRQPIMQKYIEYIQS